MKQIMILIMLLCVIGVVNADLMINAVLYDPEGPDSGKEWIELYNPTNGSINLGGYSIEAGNGANPDDWELVWDGSGTIPSNSYFLVGEADVIPSPDSVTSLGFQNGPDGCRLLHDGSVIDTLGWGELTYPEYYDGSPAADDGLLVRVSDTGENGVDFVSQEYFPHSSSGGSLQIIVQVDKRLPSIENIYFPDDQAEEGYQISPFPGRRREVKLTIDALDCDSIRVIFQDITIDTDKNGTNYTASIGLDYDMSPGIYEMIIEAESDTGHMNKTSIDFEYLSLKALDVDASKLKFDDKNLEIDGDLDISTMDNPTIRNIGNVDIDIGLMGTSMISLNDQIGIENIEFSFDGFMNSKRLNLSLNNAEVNLPIGGMLPLSLRMSIPKETDEGIYYGNLALLAIS